MQKEKYTQSQILTFYTNVNHKILRFVLRKFKNLSIKGCSRNYIAVTNIGVWWVDGKNFNIV